MEEFNQIAKIAQKCCQSCPVLVVGSGLSVPFGLPTMRELATYLIDNLNPETTEEEESWLLIRTALANGDHLEQALLNSPLTASLVPKVVGHTWNYVASADADVFKAALNRTFESPLSKLLSYFFNSSLSKVDVVTTNYDRIVEYSCDVIGLHYATAFQSGYVTAFDSRDQRVLTHRGKPVQSVKLWKVHGSLDWFMRDDGLPVRAPIFDTPPVGLQPLIVTPGVSKFERLSDEPFRSNLQGMDKALSDAAAYLCFGFGFRDRQIEPKMVECLARKNVPIVLATRTLTDEAKSFLQTKAKSNFLTLEKSGEKTLARTPERWDGVELEGDYWSVGGFLRLVATEEV